MVILPHKENGKRLRNFRRYPHRRTPRSHMRGNVPPASALREPAKQLPGANHHTTAVSPAGKTVRTGAAGLQRQCRKPFRNRQRNRKRPLHRLRNHPVRQHREERRPPVFRKNRNRSFPITVPARKRESALSMRNIIDFIPKRCKDFLIRQLRKRHCATAWESILQSGSMWTISMIFQQDRLRRNVCRKNG